MTIVSIMAISLFGTIRQPYSLHNTNNYPYVI